MVEENTYKVEKASARKDVREAIREEDPRERAAKRAEQIRQQRGDADIDSIDEFYIDPRSVPDGWSYEWKRHTFLGKEDPSYQVQVARGGWEPVPASRHPEMMPTGNYTIIERKGQILMERPLSLTIEARDVELRRARNQVRAKEAQLSATPDGTMTREHDRVKPTVKKSYTPMAIPEDK
jgi:hypothetical protein